LVKIDGYLETEEQFEYLKTLPYSLNGPLRMHISRQPKIHWVKVCKACLKLKELYQIYAFGLLKQRELRGTQFGKSFSLREFDFYMANKILKTLGP
jgi:hypothetical protein